MKHSTFALGASIAAALVTATATAAAPTRAPFEMGASEAPRVTQTVDTGRMTTLAHSHFGFIDRATSAKDPAGTARLSHLQLILTPSLQRQAALEALIASQHNPGSSRFHQWLTPDQFGAAFGVADSDIAAAVSWLKSQGFTVNQVYPNKTQIDFSGTVAQVNRAFQTRERLYTTGAETHLANATDISIPTALKPVVAGVMGLNNFRGSAKAGGSRVAHWNVGKKQFVADKPAPAAGGKAQALPVGNDPSLRALVPNDLMTMYGIRQIRDNGVTGKGITIAVVADSDMQPDDWDNFTQTFNLAKFGGTFSQIHPAPASGDNNCYDPDLQIDHEQDDAANTLLAAEWATAIAPGAHVEVATCSYFVLDDEGDAVGYPSNYFGGVFLAADNLVNAADHRPDIISASDGGNVYLTGEYFTDAASKTAIDLMWAQADAEGISVFVATGNSGSDVSFNGSVSNTYPGLSAVDANALATSPHITAVGGTDTADVLDGTTSRYFASTPSVVGGSALSYVPEIPWNQSCGNGVAAKAAGYDSVVAFCQSSLLFDPQGAYVTSFGGSGGPSVVDAKPAWQRNVYNAAKDQSRDLPDVSLFAGSFGDSTYVVTCTAAYPCSADFSGPIALAAGTSLSSAMFSGIQALVDQGLADRGLAADQGNAAPTLYALAQKQYGTPDHPAADIGTCSADKGASGTGNCVFHNITRGSNSTQCYYFNSPYIAPLANCYVYGTAAHGLIKLGLRTTDATPTSYGVSNKAYTAQPGWSFASGLGSVDAKNLLIAWRAFVNAPPAAVVTAGNSQREMVVY
jgi:subtilase family serine protease